jgi:hypothetical protein
MNFLMVGGNVINPNVMILPLVWECGFVNDRKKGDLLFAFFE